MEEEYAKPAWRPQAYVTAIGRLRKLHTDRRLLVTAYTQGPHEVCDGLPVDKCQIVHDCDTPALLEATKALILSDDVILGHGNFSAVIACYRQSPETTLATSQITMNATYIP